MGNLQLILGYHLSKGLILVSVIGSQGRGQDSEKVKGEGFINQERQALEGRLKEQR